MLYVEIEDNRGTAELLLGAKRVPGYWSETIYKDEAWKEVRGRLAQLLPDAEHFNNLNAYYARNANHQKPILDVIKMGSSFHTPDTLGCDHGRDAGAEGSVWHHRSTDNQAIHPRHPYRS